ncbi:MAG: Hsp20/alpha crystallin family protein [Candidatus Baldrarchaeia archaeon]
MGKKRHDIFDEFLKLFNSILTMLGIDENPVEHADSVKERSDNELYELLEMDDEIVVIIQILDARKEDIDIRGEGHRLYVFVRGTLRKMIEIPPPGNIKSAKATFRNGILEIRIPKVNGEIKRLRL